jgi:glycosyltransferase involved in cell wall biosynthesis
LNVLHYKSNFLNSSETFIRRVINNHHQFKPAAMCIHEKNYTQGLKVYQKPQAGIPYLVNTLCFHLNWCLPFYKETLKKIEPAIIHAHFGFDGYRMMKPAQRCSIPLVVSFYGSDVSRLPNEFDWKRRYRNLAQHGNAFIAATDHMKLRLIDLGFPKSKITVIPFGLELEKFPFKTTQSDPKKIMMVGRMVEKKGFRYAIEAIKKLKKKELRYTLDLYGDGELRRSLENQVDALGIRKWVHFHGQVPIESVLEAHLHHDILLAPSLTANDGDQEGLPNTILEAMASGTFVITTNHAAIGEVIKNGENGLIIEEGDADALANTIAFTESADCNMDEMRKNARQTIEKKFKIEDVVTQIEALYKKVIKNYD